MAAGLVVVVAGTAGLGTGNTEAAWNPVSIALGPNMMSSAGRIGLGPGAEAFRGGRATLGLQLALGNDMATLPTMVTRRCLLLEIMS
jgi:hypothetical protein